MNASHWRVPVDLASLGGDGMTETALSVLVPASTSNIGAGFDCLGVALDLWLEARIVPGDGPPSYRGTLVGLMPDEDIVVQLLRSAPLPEGHRLVMRSEIPVAKGLGSSAAATVAGITLAALLRGGSPDKDVVYQEAVRREGHPDNAGAAVYGGAVLAVRWSGPDDESGDTEPRTIQLANELGFAVAVPEQCIDTTHARNLLPDHVNRALAVGQASRAAALVIGLQQGNGDLIAIGMEDLIATPARSGLIEGYDTACEAGIDAGAYGVTISGSGASLVGIAPRDRTSAVAGAMARALTDAGNAAEAYTPLPSSAGVSWRRDDMPLSPLNPETLEAPFQ